MRNTLIYVLMAVALVLGAGIAYGEFNNIQYAQKQNDSVQEVKEYKTTAEKDKLLAKNKQAKYQEGNQDPKIEGDEAYNDSAAY